MLKLLHRHAAMFTVACVAFASGYAVATAREEMIQAKPLFSTSETILGETFAYPSGKPLISSAVVTMQPGAETGWHTHGVPLTGMVLEGELTVDYGTKGKRTYAAGEAIVESMVTPHNGRNSGSGPMRLFAVYIGAEGSVTTLPQKKE